MDMIRYLVPALAVFAAVTATFGNLAAYMQTNLKRLLAYSTIAHAGYMLMGLCTLTRAGVEAVLFYLAAYLFMNLGAFAVVAFLRNQTGSEDLDDFRGLIRRSPVLVVTLSFFLLSLLGIPPLVGFAAKFQIFAALYTEGQAYYRATPSEPVLGGTLIALLVIGGLNTVLSAFYYLKVMKVMILDRVTEDLEGTEPAPLRTPFWPAFYSVMLVLVVVVLGVLWGPLDSVSAQGVARLRKQPGVTPAVTGGGPPGGGPAAMGAAVGPPPDPGAGMPALPTRPPMDKVLEQPVTESAGKPIPFSDALGHFRNRYALRIATVDKAIRDRVQDKKVTIPPAKSMPLKELFQRVLSQVDLSYEIVEDTIKLIPARDKAKEKGK
jgi:hypothetical protein